MFELDDDFDFNDEDFDKICTGKTLEKSPKFTSVQTNNEKREKKLEEDQSILNPFTDDDDELILSVIEPESSHKQTGPQENEPEIIEIVDSVEQDQETPQSVTSKVRTSTEKPQVESSFFNTPGNKSSIFSPSSRLDSSASFSPIVCKRKFPGPAGLLPKRTPNSFSNSHASPLMDLNFDDCSSLQKTVCSQSSGASFEAEPWQRLLKDHKTIKKEDCMLNNFSVAWVKRKGIARQFVKNRVPFLAALVTSLDCSTVDQGSGPVVLLKDPTGEIHGTLLREAWDTFGHYLSIGSAVILRQVAVYSAGITTGQQYLNISSKSIAVIYPADTNLSFKIEVLPVSNQEVVEKIAEWKKIGQQSNNESPLVKNTAPSNAPRSLFNSGRNIHQSKSSPCIGEPASKRPCYESNTFRRNNVPSPFPLSSNKSTNQVHKSNLTNSNSRISLNSPRPPQVSNSSPKISLSNSVVPPSNNSKMCAGESINPKVTTRSVESNSAAKTKENKVPESKTLITSLSKINNEDMSVLTSVLEGIDADMFDDF